MNEKRQPDLELLLAILISDGANEIEVEYDDHEWWVSVIEGNTGLGVARYSTEEEKIRVDAALRRLQKEKRISVNGSMHRLSFESRENFDEPAWTIRVTKMKRQPNATREGKDPR